MTDRIVSPDSTSVSGATCCQLPSPPPLYSFTAILLIELISSQGSSWALIPVKLAGSANLESAAWGGVQPVRRMLPKAAGTVRFISSATGLCWVNYRSAYASPVTVFENGDETHSYSILFLPLFSFFLSFFLFLSFFPDEKQRNRDLISTKGRYSLLCRIFCCETYPIPAGDKATGASGKSITSV